MTSLTSITTNRSLFSRNFVLLWFGQVVSILGDVIFDTTLVLWIAAVLAPRQTWTPLAVSGVLFAAAIPSFLFGPIAGVFVDRWDKRQTLLWMDALRAILITFLLLSTGIVPLPFFVQGHLPILWQLAAIYSVVFLTSTCTQFFTPARFALSSDIVAEPLRARASGIAQTTANLALIIGPPLAAPLLFSVGVQWALGINALSFVISFLAMLLVRLPKQETIVQVDFVQNNFISEFRTGLHFLITQPVLRTIVLTMFILLFGGTVGSTLEFFFATQNLHASTYLFGFLSSATGAGLLVGALLAIWGLQRLGIAKSFWLGVIVISVMEIIYARLTNFPLAIAFLFLQGIPNAAINVAISPLIMQVTPKALLGRVFALYIPIINSATLLSTLLTGYLASVLHGLHTTVLGIAIGPIDTMIMCAGFLTLGGGLYAMRKLRRLQEKQGDHKGLLYT